MIKFLKVERFDLAIHVWWTHSKKKKRQTDKSENLSFFSECVFFHFVEDLKQDLEDLKMSIKGMSIGDMYRQSAFYKLFSLL